MKKLIRVFLGIGMICLGVWLLAKTEQVEVVEKQHESANARLLFNPFFTHIGMMKSVN